MGTTTPETQTPVEGIQALLKQFPSLSVYFETGGHTLTLSFEDKTTKQVVIVTVFKLDSLGLYLGEQVSAEDVSSLQIIAHIKGATPEDYLFINTSEYCGGIESGTQLLESGVLDTQEILPHINAGISLARYFLSYDLSEGEDVCRERINFSSDVLGPAQKDGCLEFLKFTKVELDRCRQ